MYSDTTHLCVHLWKEQFTLCIFLMMAMVKVSKLSSGVTGLETWQEAQVELSAEM